MLVVGLERPHRRSPLNDRRPAEAGRPACSGAGERLQRGDVDGLGPLVPGLGVVADARALGEGLEALGVDARVVDEEVLARVIRRDEAEALVVVEPLDGSGGHVWGPSWDIGAAITEGAQKATTRNAGTACVGVVPDCGRVQGYRSPRSECGAATTSGGPTWGPRRAAGGPAGGSGLRGLRVRPDDDRVGDRDDLVDRKAGARGVLADRLRARGLVDADGADRAAALVEDVGADPADVVGHLDVADLGRSARGLFELGAGAPAATAQDRVELHVVCLRVVACEYAVDTTPAAAAAHRTGSLSFDDPEAGAAAPASPRLRTSSLRRIAQTWWPGLLRDEQAPGDVGVAPPLCDEGEHFDLPRREPRRVRARGAVRPAADVAQAALAQRPGDPPRGRAGPEALERVERAAPAVRLGRM